MIRSARMKKTVERKRSISTPIMKKPRENGAFLFYTGYERSASAYLI